jgi:hypothetical protein
MLARNSSPETPLATETPRHLQARDWKASFEAVEKERDEAMAKRRALAIAIDRAAARTGWSDHARIAWLEGRAGNEDDPRKTLTALRDRLWDVMCEHGVDTAGMEDEPKIAALSEMLSAHRTLQRESHRNPRAQRVVQLRPR